MRLLVTIGNISWVKLCLLMTKWKDVLWNEKSGCSI